MLNNLRTDQSDQSGSLDCVVNPSMFQGGGEMRNKMQNLTLNDMQSDLSISSKGRH